MDTYVVIQLKDKKEKVLILNLLASETEARFIVTSDLMDYVAKQFHVKIIDENEDEILVSSQQLVENTQEEQGIVNFTSSTTNIADIVPPTVDFGNKEIAQDDTYENNQAETTTIEIKQEPIDEDFESQTASAATKTVVQTKLVEKSVKRCQESVTKAKNVTKEYYGPTCPKEIKIEQPTEEIKSKCREETRKRRRNDSEGSRTHQAKKICKSDDKKTKMSQCLRCGAIKAYSNEEKIEHAAFHIKMSRFECSMGGCYFKSGHEEVIGRHIKNKHKGRDAKVRDVQLTREQQKELDEAIKECFTEFKKPFDKNTCQVCNEKILGKERDWSEFKRQHALIHRDFMRYQCVEKDCKFKSATEKSMSEHVRLQHDRRRISSRSKVELTDQQRLEIKKMLIKCFPEFDC